jgi:hypothetical protein
LNKAFGGISVNQIDEAADNPASKRRPRRPKR